MSSCSITNKCLSALGRKNAFPGAGLFFSERKRFTTGEKSTMIYGNNRQEDMGYG